ncbi:hypothetical protein [Nocardia sp. IFM 10818]
MSDRRHRVHEGGHVGHRVGGVGQAGHRIRGASRVGHRIRGTGRAGHRIRGIGGEGRRARGVDDGRWHVPHAGRFEFGSQIGDFGGQLVAQVDAFVEAGAHAGNGVVHGGQAAVGAPQVVFDDRAAVDHGAGIADPLLDVGQPGGGLGHLLVVEALPEGGLGGEDLVLGPAGGEVGQLGEGQLAGAGHRGREPVAAHQVQFQFGGVARVRVEHAHPGPVGGGQQRLENVLLHGAAAQPGDADAQVVGGGGHLVPVHLTPLSDRLVERQRVRRYPGSARCPWQTCARCGARPRAKSRAAGYGRCGLAPPSTTMRWPVR